MGVRLTVGSKDQKVSGVLGRPEEGSGSISDGSKGRCKARLIQGGSYI